MHRTARLQDKRRAPKGLRRHRPKRRPPKAAEEPNSSLTGRLDEAFERFQLLCEDDRRLCQTPLELIGLIGLNLTEVAELIEKTGGDTASSSAIFEKIAFTDGLLTALETGVYPLIGRWRKADRQLFEAADPLLERLFYNLTKKGKGKLADSLRLAVKEAAQIAESKPRVALELLTAVVTVIGNN